VEALLQSLYVGDYEDCLGGDQTTSSTAQSSCHDLNTHDGLALHVEMFTCADKYDLPNLALLATQKFKAQLQHSWATSSLVRAVSMIYNSNLAGDGIEERSSGSDSDTLHSAASSSVISSTVPAEFTDTPSHIITTLIEKHPLRGHLLAFLSDHLSALAHSPLEQVVVLRALLHALPLFAGDICHLTFSQSWRKLRSNSIRSSSISDAGVGSTHLRRQSSERRHDTLQPPDTPTSVDSWHIIDTESPIRRRLSLATSAIVSAFTKVLPASPQRFDPTLTLTSEPTATGRRNEKYSCNKCQCEYTVHEPGMEYEFVCPRVSCGGRAEWDERLE
jgi:hypothetical protein